MPQIELVPRASLTETTWWGKLTSSEQRTVLLETQGFVETRVRFGLSRLAMGKHLVALRAVLDPKQLWTAYLHSQHNISKATAHRYIVAYETVADRLPELVLRVAIALGYDTIDPKIIERMPPPKTEDRKKIVTYLRNVHDAARQKRKRQQHTEVVGDPDTLMKEALHCVIQRFERLPNTGRVRAKWREQFVCMLMNELGVTEERSFTPIPVPSNLRVMMGRPRLPSHAQAA